MNSETRPIWIDLDNSPHVPFFSPIIDELRRRGTEVAVTARDAYNVTDLLRLYRVEATVIGHHDGGNKLAKVLGLGRRCAHLLPFIARLRPSVAVSHGSRAQLLASKLMRVSSVVIADYEHVTHVARPTMLIVPQIMSGAVTEHLAQQVATYPGIKEDVYACAFSPDDAIRPQLGLADTDVVVTLRPPATEAHYHNPESETLFAAAVEHIANDRRTRLVMLPRNDRQKTDLRRRYAGLLDCAKMIVPERAVEGLNLVWHSDLVVSGGGTMNREAAALGVPVYSTFRGQIGAVDRYLAAHGRLTLLESVAEVPQKLVLRRRKPSGSGRSISRRSLDVIVDHLIAAADRQTIGLSLTHTRES